MPKLSGDKISSYVRKDGKKVIALSVSEDFEKRIVAAANKEELSRQSYIIVAINAALEKSEGDSNT